MLAQLFLCLAVVDITLGHPQVSIIYPIIGKTVEGRSPRLDDDSVRVGRVDTNCEGILRPQNPDCCFMTDPNHERTKDWTQPLENSPYKINLVAVEHRTLNKFTKTEFNNSDMWKLTPLIDNPYTNKQEPGGPIKLQIYAEETSTGFDQFWVQAKKFIAPSSWMLSGDFIEIENVAVYPNETMHDGQQKVGCDKDMYNNNEKATIVSHSKFNEERDGLELEWNPPQRCTEEQLQSGDTMKCRTKDDIFFFTFTMGNTKSQLFWVGQNSFGFYLDHEFDKPDEEK